MTTSWQLTHKAQSILHSVTLALKMETVHSSKHSHLPTTLHGVTIQKIIIWILLPHHSKHWNYNSYSTYKNWIWYDLPWCPRVHHEVSVADPPPQFLEPCSVLWFLLKLEPRCYQAYSSLCHQDRTSADRHPAHTVIVSGKTVFFLNKVGNSQLKASQTIAELSEHLGYWLLVAVMIKCCSLHLLQ